MISCTSYPTRAARRFSAAALSAWLMLAASGAQAGRPLVVDDANVNDTGKGHVEIWHTRAEGVRMLSLAPAYAPIDGLELAASVSRDSGADARQTALQLKWRITPSQENGCNVGTSAGVAWSRVAGQRARTPYLNGLASCNLGGTASVHLNLGVVREDGGGTTRNGGVAVEREFGPVTGHLEWFGAQGTKPTLNLGLRGMLTDTLQLDGSIGRGDGVTITTLGVKVLF